MNTKAQPLTFEGHLKRRLLTHLKRLGFIIGENSQLTPVSFGKRRIRLIHRHKRSALLKKESGFIREEWPRLRKHFANGDEVDPAKIMPRLEAIKAGTWQSKLFRLAALSWSVPVSAGYGRRMRFLVWDSSNDKLIGLVALGDPVFNLGVRDTEIGWSARDRERRLVNVLDAYVLGAVPPYANLLGGKLVASLLRTKEVRNAFKARYAQATGIISGKKKRPSLVMITTTSSLGRSSIYNRLSLNGHRILKSVGYTSGWGHFHISEELFSLARKVLSAHDHKYADGHQFGDGPNWRLRAVRKALSLAGLNPNVLRHGIRREVFLCFLAVNAKGVLRGTAKTPRFVYLPKVADTGQQARERWIVPRSLRRPEFRSWRASRLLARLRLKTAKETKQVDREKVRHYGTG